MNCGSAGDLEEDEVDILLSRGFVVSFSKIEKLIQEAVSKRINRLQLRFFRGWPFVGVRIRWGTLSGYIELILRADVVDMRSLLSS